MEMNPRLKERALMQLRQAVYHQIKLWDFARPLAEIQNLDLHEVFSYVQQISVTADTGMELQEKDLDDFLGLEPVNPWRSERDYRLTDNTSDAGSDEQK